MKSKLKYSGDFGNFDCPKCFSYNRIVIKDEILDFYYCSYCGLYIEVTK